MLRCMDFFGKRTKNIQPTYFTRGLDATLIQEYWPVYHTLVPVPVELIRTYATVAKEIVRDTKSKTTGRDDNAHCGRHFVS